MRLDLGLQPGDRVAVMMPNVPQYPVAVAAILSAGFVVVNVNPLYTARELQHQLQDSGAKAIVIVENFANTLQQVLPRTQVKKVVVTPLGEMLGLKGLLVNFVVKHIKKMVPAFSLPGSMRFNDVLAETGVPNAVTIAETPCETAVVISPLIAALSLFVSASLARAGDAKADKPDPAPIILALGNLGAMAGADVWYLGDTASDMQAARAAGVTGVLVGDASHDGGIERAAPDMHFGSAHALAAHLRSLA